MTCYTNNFTNNTQNNRVNTLNANTATNSNNNQIAQINAQAKRIDDMATEILQLKEEIKGNDARILKLERAVSKQRKAEAKWDIQNDFGGGF